MRGQIFEINGHSFFVFGGAYSVDRDSRTWFEEEIPIGEEYDEAWQNLKNADYQVDYVITHTAPYEIVSAMGYGSFDKALEHTRELQYMSEQIDYLSWFFGHFHDDADIDNFHCLFENVVSLDDYN